MEGIEPTVHINDSTSIHFSLIFFHLKIILKLLDDRRLLVDWFMIFVIGCWCRVHICVQSVDQNDKYFFARNSVRVHYNLLNLNQSTHIDRTDIESRKNG